MTRAILKGLVLISVVVATGCGGASKESQTASSSRGTTRTTDREKPNYIPPANPYGRMSEAVLDTLRRLKKLHAISRDEYWDLEGGVLANDYFEVWYPAGRTTVTHGMRVFNEIMPARHKFVEFFGRAPEERLVILVPEFMEHYTEDTGRDWWYYGDLRADSLTFQPVYVLVKRNLASIAIPHEYYQWAVGRLTNYGATRWLEEGVASYLSDEGPLLEIQMKEFPAESHAMTPAQVDEALIREETKAASRIAYYHSWRMVKQIVDEYGEEKLKRMLLAMGDGHTLDEACRQTLNVSYDELMTRVAEAAQASDESQGS